MKTSHSHSENNQKSHYVNTILVVIFLVVFGCYVITFPLANRSNEHAYSNAAGSMQSVF